MHSGPGPGDPGGLHRPPSGSSLHNEMTSLSSSVGRSLGLEAFQQALSRDNSEEQLLNYPRPPGSHLPTVSEDDIFSAVGGLEVTQHDLDLAQHAAAAAEVFARGRPQTTVEPSRTLLVRGVPADTSDEELRGIFKAFGDVRGLYTATKDAGLVVVAYFDIRAAASALSTLQGTLIQNSAIDISFSPYMPQRGSPEQAGVNQGQVSLFNMDPETTNDHLVWLFSKFGEVQGCHESPARPTQKFITFYDVRHAAAALQAMNRADQLNKLPSHLTPAQVANLQSRTSAPHLLQLAQLAQMAEKGGDSGAGMAAGVSASGSTGGLPHGPSWESGGTSPVTMEGLLQLMKVTGSQAHQQHGVQRAGSNSSLQQPSPSLSQHDLQGLAHNIQQHGPQGMGHMPPGGPGVSQQGSGMPPYPGQRGMGSMDPRAAMSAMRMSDSASSIAGVPGNFMAVAAGAGLPKGYPPHMPFNPAAAAAGGPGAQGRHGVGAGLDKGNAALYANQQLQFLQAQQEAANMLMGLNLGGGGGNGGEQGLTQQQQGGQQQGQWPDGNPAASGLGVNPDSYNAAAAAMAAAALFGSGAGASGAGPSSGLPHGQPHFNSQLHDLQLRQQQAAAAQLQAAHQQQNLHQLAMAQMQALQAAGGVGGYNAANLQAAAQILQAAGLHNLGAGPGQPPHARALGMSAAAHILQQAGLGMPGLGAYAQHLALNPHAALLAAGAAGGGRGIGFGGRGGLMGPHSDMGPGGVAGGGRTGGRLSRRTTDPVAEAERKAQQEKLYALDLEKIARGEDKRTTLMIKNIPNKYTQKMLLATIDEHFKGTYDFFYLPIDFKNKCNVGYAFINMIQAVSIIPFVQRFNLKKWERFNSEKVCSISYARIQGRAALVQHFQNSSLMHEDKRCRPILFTLEESGDIAGEQEPFPPATREASSTSAPGSSTGAPGKGDGPSSRHGSSNKLSGLGGSTNSLRSFGQGNSRHGSSTNLHLHAAVGGGGGGGGGGTSNGRR